MSTSIKELAAEAKALAPETRSLAAEVKKMDAAVKTAATQANLFGGSLNTLKQQQAALRQGITALVDGGLRPESKEIQNLVKQYQNLSGEISRTEQETGGGVDAFNRLSGAIRQTASVAVLLKGLDIAKNLGAFALAQADAFQTARNELGILLGDMEAGAGLFNRLKAFNDKTPFNLETTQQAAKVLLSADVPLSQINEHLTRFGDLSQGNAQRFSSYVNAFSKGAAKGRVDMETLNTYIDQGIPILDELGQGFGATKNEVIDMVSQGKVSFEDFSTALERLTAEGGRYFGGMELSSKSLAAMQEGLRESVSSLAASFGDMLLPAAVAVVGILTALTNAINDSPLAKGILAGAVVALTGYLTVLAVKQTVLTVKTWLQYAAQTGLNAAMAVGNPLLLAGIVAAGAATVAAVAYAASQQKAAEAAGELALKQVEQKEALEKSAEAVDQYIQSMQNKTDEEIRNAIAQTEAFRAKPFRIISPEDFQRETKQLDGLYKLLDDRRADWINAMFGDTQAGKIQKINEQLATAKRFLADLGATDTEKTQLNQIIRLLTEDLKKLTETADDAKRALDDKATKWKESWAKEYEKFQAEQSIDPFATINVELQIRKNEAEINGIGPLNARYIKEIESVYAAKRTEIAEALRREEEKRLRDLSETQVDNLEYEKAAELEKINTLEAQRVIAAAGSEAEILAIRERYAAMRADTEESFDKQITDTRIKEAERARNAERDAVMEVHSLQMENFKKEWEYRREQARRRVENGKGGSAQFIAAEFMSQSSGTQLGELFSKFGAAMQGASQGAQAAGGAMQNAAGGASVAAGAWLALLKALVDATMELENAKKTVNWANTIVNKAFEKVGPMINRALAEFSDPLEEVGEIVGGVASVFAGLGVIATSFNRLVSRVVLEPLRMLGQAFEWLYNNVIYPLGNVIIGVMNGIIDALNQIPFVEIEKLEYLEKIGEEAEEMAREMEKQKERITALYERQKERVRDELSAQIDSLRAQYELGLISRAEYTAGAEAYAKTANEELITINEEMKKILEDIEKNTDAVLTEDQRKLVDNVKKEGPAAVGIIVANALDPMTTGTVSAIADAVQGNWADAGLNLITGGLYGAMKGLFGFDTGTPYVPRNMTAVVHQGEGIIPRTFNEGIRRGDYALIGGGGTATSENGGGTVIHVTVNVEGSVIKKDDLVAEIYNGIAGGITGGRLAPLPS
jgi:tape measure domain-containing protein